MQIEKLLEQLLLIEDDKLRMEKPPKTFEDDPMNFILNKYQNLKEILTELMTGNFEEYITGIYIIAPKPTTFKIVLHNGQYFFLTYTQEAYQATIAGKNYFLMTVGEKQRAMLAISRLLRWGSPLKTKGPEGAEQGAEATDTGETTETPPAEGGEEAGGEEETLSEITAVKQIISQYDIIKEAKEEASQFEQISVDLWNAAVAGSKNAPIEYKKYESLFQSIKKIVNKLKTKDKLTKYSQQRDAVSKWWTQAHGSKTKDEPKTDIKSENSKYRISVKKGKSQLMSPEKKEAVATIKAAAEASGLSSKLEKKAIEIVNKFAARTKTSGLNTTELSKSPKAKLNKINKIAKEIYNDAYEAHREFIEFTNSTFKSNPDFKREFAFEAATGKKKFGDPGGNTDAEANWVLSISNSGDSAELHEIKSSSSPIVSKIVANMKVNVTMKSNHYKIKGEYAGYGFYSSARIALDDLLKKSNELTEVYEKYEKEKSEGLLNEEKDKLYENIFKKAFNWIKNKVEEIWNFLTEKIKQTIQLIKSGFENLLKAMEVEPEVPEEVYTQQIQFA